MSKSRMSLQSQCLGVDMCYIIFFYHMGINKQERVNLLSMLIKYFRKAVNTLHCNPRHLYIQILNPVRTLPAIVSLLTTCISIFYFTF